jgi:hypothetical protein
MRRTKGETAMYANSDDLLAEMRGSAKFIVEVCGYLPDQYVFTRTDIVLSDEGILSSYLVVDFIMEWIADGGFSALIDDEDYNADFDDFLAETMWFWNPDEADHRLEDRFP